MPQTVHSEETCETSKDSSPNVKGGLSDSADFRVSRQQSTTTQNCSSYTSTARATNFSNVFGKSTFTAVTQSAGEMSPHPAQESRAMVAGPGETGMKPTNYQQEATNSLDQDDDERRRKREGDDIATSEYRENKKIRSENIEEKVRRLKMENKQLKNVIKKSYKEIKAIRSQLEKLDAPNHLLAEIDKQLRRFQLQDM